MLTKKERDYIADVYRGNPMVESLLADLGEQEAELAKLRAALRKVMQLCSLVDNEPRIVGQIDAVAVLAPSRRQLGGEIMLTFIEWCNQLDQVAIKDGYRGLSIVSETGAECWRHYYDDNETPEAAWAEELTYA